MKSLLKALVGVAIPFAVVLLILTRNAPRPAEAPPPPELGDQEIAGVAPGGDSPDGLWRIPDRTGSYVGYRIIERRPRLAGEFEVAGRSTAVTGELVIDARTVERLIVTADLRRLHSDSLQRDRALGPRYLEIDRYPEARFQLDEPVKLDAVPGQGEEIATQVEGQLTLHGVTRPVTVAVRARWVGDELEVAGSTAIRLADFDIEVPALPGFVFAADEGVMEFSLLFERTGRAN